MTKTQSIVQSIGLSNLITIGVLIVGMTGTFVGLSVKVDSISSKLQEEVVQRQVEDERLRMEIEKNWDRNTSDHKALSESLDCIQKSIQNLDTSMEYHLGYHAGKGK